MTSALTERLVGRCATCVHRAEAMSPGRYHCELAASNEGAAIHESLAVAQDGEGWHAELWVSDEFGCVQHEPSGEELDP